MTKLHIFYKNTLTKRLNIVFNFLGILVVRSPSKSTPFLSAVSLRERLFSPRKKNFNLYRKYLYVKFIHTSNLKLFPNVNSSATNTTNNTTNNTTDNVNKYYFNNLPEDLINVLKLRIKEHDFYKNSSDLINTKDVDLIASKIKLLMDNAEIAVDKGRTSILDTRSWFLKAALSIVTDKNSNT